MTATTWRELPAAVRSQVAVARRWGFWGTLAAAFVAIGAVATVQRFALGLGRTTNLTDHFPWGLWIGLDFLGIGLAAAGFTIVASVHIFHVHRFEPIVRPALLTAFIGYVLVMVVLVVDLGRPDRFWHALFMWNPHSVMFEITWCLILYSTVLAFEFAPVALQRFGITAPLPLLRKIALPFILAGVVLSTLHQSSFGSLYLIVPGRLHPLWYSPLLPVLFFMSCLAAGLSTVVFLCLHVTRYGRRRLPVAVLPDLAKVVAVVLALYGLVRLQDLADRGVLRAGTLGSYEGLMFAGEFLIGVVAPLAVLALPRARRQRAGLYAASTLVLMGFAANRMNTVVTGLESWPHTTYFPSWQEIAISLGIAALGCTLFALAARYFGVIPEGADDPGQGSAEQAALPAGLPLPRRRHFALLALIPTALLVASLYATSVLEETAETGQSPPPPAPPVDLARGLAAFEFPRDVTFERGDGSPGAVTFRHLSHVDARAPECASCHAAGFSLLGRERGGPAPAAGVMHDDRQCGRCHDAAQDCGFCHAG
ncbi:MAG: Ni/Fe-hydrogenase cytochrome b subunit [Acidobacteria bacterium]|jgi:Ni/Fe-hydrogenase subunit HybB-like protein|nr:Ni/Fe-hydrogenase cytochrome b subunit [Acidobacteriota bacterium]